MNSKAKGNRDKSDKWMLSMRESKEAGARLCWMGQGALRKDF